MLIKKNNFLLIYLQVLQLSKNMSIGEFDVCHEFVNFVNSVLYLMKKNLLFWIIW